MEAILFFAFLGLQPEQNLFIYKNNVSENIEYCTNISFDPNMVEEFDKECNREEVNNYQLYVKR
jgi:hypothetical protein